MSLFSPFLTCSGQLGYALVFRIASGGLFGPDQPVILQLIELEQGTLLALSVSVIGIFPSI
jgi:hypothetical protein